MGYSPWVYKELDMTNNLNRNKFLFSEIKTICIQKIINFPLA